MRLPLPSDTVADCAFPAQITEGSLTNNMFMGILLDLMIFTSGVCRLNGFMLWQYHQDTPIEVVEWNWSDFER
jgi:undecaprenyl diphosphate synthase